LLQDSHVHSAAKQLVLLLIGPDPDQSSNLAEGIHSAFIAASGESGYDQVSAQILSIDEDVAAYVDPTSSWPRMSDHDVEELRDVLPFAAARRILSDPHGGQHPLVLATPSPGRTVAFWQEVARQEHAQIAAVLAIPSPLSAKGNGQMIDWLQHALLAERVTRGMPRMVAMLDDERHDAQDAALAWVAAHANLTPPPMSRPVGEPQETEACQTPRRDRGLTDVRPGFNSWVRRCEAAFMQLARDGESETLYREFDRIAANLDAARALFAPILGDSQVSLERLKLQNDRLRAQKDELQNTDADGQRAMLAAEIALLHVQAGEREAELAQSRHELNAMRVWCDDVGSRSMLTQGQLLDTRLKLGSASISSERMSQMLLAHGHRQLKTWDKPLARWVARRGWGFKSARRLAHHLAIIEQFLDELSWPLIGVHPDGRRERILAYLTGATDFLPDFPFVQDLEYGEMYPDVPPSGMRPLVHFILHGQIEQRNPHPLFETSYYLVQCPEAAHLASSAVVHYLKWGKDKGHDPHPLFSTRGYAQRYPDVVGRNPLVHWIEHYRNICDPLFDPQFYLDSYPDVATAGRNPLTHYLATGWREGRNPNPWFDTRYYLANNPDVAREQINPLIHYVIKGWRQRMRPALNFDTAFYLANDPELTDADPLRHFIERGRAEGRATLPPEPAPNELPADEPLQNNVAPGLVATLPIDQESANSSAIAQVAKPPVIAAKRNARPVAMMVEALYPRPDLDSGSLDHVNFARIFQRLGYEVHYLSLLEFGKDHDDRSGHYRALMESMGVRCITSQDYAYFEEYYFDVGDSVEVCFVSRVHFGAIQMESLRQLCPAARIVFNTVDLHFVREERQGALRNDPALIMRARQTREMEVNFALQADATIVVSSSEKTILDDLAPEANTHVMPLIRQFEKPRDTTFAKRRDIAFIGGFNHQPNVDAIDHFLADIWPLVRQRRPDIGFRVVGANMPPEWNRRKEKGVTFVGFVEDMEDELAGLRMTVAPLRYGAGAKGKLVSSLAAGVPAVVSGIASEGMGLVAGESVLVADTPDDFADAIIRLYDDETLWTNLSRHGAAFIRKNYSIDTGQTIMCNILTELGVTLPVANQDAC